MALEEEAAPSDATQMLGDCNGEPMVEVSDSYADEVRLEGTGRLMDGRVINLGDCDCGDGYNCFMWIDEGTSPWGLGSRGNPLVPYVSMGMVSFRNCSNCMQLPMTLNTGRRFSWRHLMVCRCQA